jgi:hypothetical protein
VVSLGVATLGTAAPSRVSVFEFGGCFCGRDHVFVFVFLYFFCNARDGAGCLGVLGGGER